MGLVHEGMAQHGTAVFTHEQTKGKGQRNKQWHSQKGQNIAISLVIDPQTYTLPNPFFLSMTVAIGVYNFFNRYVGDEVKIKWPNDIYWRDRKAAGILIENIWQGNEWKYAIAGVGINVNQTNFGELATKAVSLKQITGKHHEPIILAKELCQDMDSQLNLLKYDPGKITTIYKSLLYKLNQPIKLRKENRVFEATLSTVNQSGQLIVKHSIEEAFNVGEVEWVM
jgi:BirA family biotin operon repressor/biotin-[acetyl-CoA-carboxylase] ligase